MDRSTIRQHVSLGALIFAQLLVLFGLFGCTSTHESTILISSDRSAHVLVTGSNPSIELRAEPQQIVDVTWQIASAPEEKQTLRGYLARTMRGGGAFVLTSGKPTTVHVICKGASGFGVAQPANIAARTPVRQ